MNGQGHRQRPRQRPRRPPEAARDGHSPARRVAEDDPSSELYAESADADGVLDYVAMHSQRDVRHDQGE